MRGGRKLRPEEKYDVAYKDERYASPAASIGLGWVPWVVANLRFKSVLDVGCGSGYALLKFLEAGKSAVGTEVSEYLLNGRLISFKELGFVQRAFARDLGMWSEGSFDLVFCSEVLEHIPLEDIHNSIGELIRVSSKLLFFTICFREAWCFPDLKLHETVRPQAWWEGEFEKFRVKWKEVTTKGSERGGTYVLRKW